MRKIIDSHIHLDQYKNEDIKKIIIGSSSLEGLITVSTDLKSAKRNLELAEKHSIVYPAFGFHPEQALPHEKDLDSFLKWIERNNDHMVAIGEVGLPYYLKNVSKSSTFPIHQYIQILEQFILLAKKLNKPIIIHAVYEDASIVCDLLEKHSVKKAHFHWFKGDDRTISRLIENRFLISFTPDIVYRNKIQIMAKKYPLELIMAETDGPWPFEGPFKEQLTSPEFIHKSIETLSHLKQDRIETVYKQLLINTQTFYSI